MERHNQITKAQLQQELQVNNFDTHLAEWLNSGFVTQSGNMLEFPKDSQQLVENYISLCDSKEQCKST